MSAFMRAKMTVDRIERWNGADKVHLNAVCKSGTYPPDGSDEDNTFAKFTPTGEVTLTIANPALIGNVEPGDTFYLDFTKVEKPAPASA